MNDLANHQVKLSHTYHITKSCWGLKDSTCEEPHCQSDFGMAVKTKQQVGEKGGSKMDGKENNYCSVALWILERLKDNKSRQNG